MCTAFSMNTKDHYFGRNLDIDCSYGEEVCIMPRYFPIDYREMGKVSEHYALIGMATVVKNIPLFYEASNEHGLSMAGLNFPGNAYYPSVKAGKDNIAPFEFIPWILGQCRNVSDAKVLLNRINIADIPFSKEIQSSPLHWMLDDCKESLVIESRKGGLDIHDNPVHVLTNNPPFEYQLSNLDNYRHLRVDNAEVIREKNPDYETYSQGLGAVGLPGDVSSMSRFVRIAFGLKNTVCDNDELSSVGQFFHLLSSVEMIKGACVTDNETLDVTVYSACMNVNRGLYYYTTYDNRQITCIDMYGVDLDSDTISRFPLNLKQNILYQNSI